MNQAIVKVVRQAATVAAFVLSAFSVSYAAAPKDTGIPAEQNAARNDSINRAVATVMAANVDEVLSNLVKADVMLDRAEVGRYIADYLANRPLGFTREDASKYIDGMVFASRGARPDTLSRDTQQAYLDEMAATPGAVKMPSGLVFIVLKEGEGAEPTIKDRVKVKYVAQLSDGTVFDDTENEAIMFDVAGVIPGFAEGLMQMKPNGTYRLVIPSDIAYGAEGIPGIIPGNAVLDFTVTLEDVLPAAR